MKKNKLTKEVQSIELLNLRINLASQLREFSTKEGNRVFNDEWLITNVLKMDIPENTKK
jgi:hypothetical protein